MVRLLISAAFRSQKLNKSKSESNCIDDVQINSSQSCDQLDHNSKGGGRVLFIREDIPLNVEKYSIEAFYVEINLRKSKKWLCCTYNPNEKNIHAYLWNLENTLNFYPSSYESHLNMGHFNFGPENSYKKLF